MTELADKRRAKSRDRIVSSVEELAAAVADVDHALDHEDAIDMLAMYGILADVVNLARDAQAVVGQAIIEVLPNQYEPQQVPGGGIFKVGGGKERKAFDNERVISVAASRMCEQMDIGGVLSTDGEVTPDLTAINHSLHEFAEFAGAHTPSFNSWRTTQAKAYGIKLDDFCEIERSPVTHRIEGRKRT